MWQSIRIIATLKGKDLSNTSEVIDCKFLLSHGGIE